MRLLRALAAPLGLAAAGLAGCFTTPSHPTHPTTTIETRPTPVTRPPAVQAVPDAVPRVEPRSHHGNPPFYEVYGKRYYVLSSSADYLERGVASWYGPGFHKVKTSTGEIYDMYGMTAAHKTLPLPAYVRVTNLQNGRSVVVRVNDRGPFVGNRIIDLSYTAASRLDMLRNGTALVEVRALEPTTGLAAATNPTPATNPTTATNSAPAAAPSAAGGSALFVQAGAFSDPTNAERLAAKLRDRGYGKIFIRDDILAGRKMYRVRIGPVPEVAEFDRIMTALEHAGVRDAHLAMD